MANENRPGLFKVIVSRTTVRRTPGTLFIGSLLLNDPFYVEHVHPSDHQWVWGYGGIHFLDFGWVRLAGRLVPEHHQKARAEKDARQVSDFLKHGHRNMPVSHYAQPPLPHGSTATRHVNIVASTPFYLNHSHGAGRNDGAALGIPATLEPGKKVSWRYLTKDNLHCVVYHPLGYALRNHGKWGFIRNDANCTIDPPL